MLVPIAYFTLVVSITVAPVSSFFTSNTSTGSLPPAACPPKMTSTPAGTLGPKAALGASPSVGSMPLLP